MVRFAICLAATLVSMTLCMAVPCMAHDLGLAQVTVTVGSDGNIALRSRLSATINAVDPLVSGSCAASTQRRAEPDGQNQIIETRLDCTQGSADAEVLFPWQVSGVFLRTSGAGENSVSQFLPAGPEGVRLSLGTFVQMDSSLLDTAALYIQLGVKHILIGIDHLALLLCLSMLARGMNLVRLVTAFTIGHSITLCLAALKIVQVPVAPVEVLIVLSVAYLARDVLQGRKLGRSNSVLLAGIGLLHGLGFASVLSEIGLPQSQLLPALISFNIGIEIGQLIFLAGVFVLFALFQRIAPVALAKPAPYLASFLIGALAMFWTFERIAEFHL